MASAFILISCITNPGCRRPPADLEIGSPAPEFKLPDLHGKEVSLSDYRGRVVLLDFWASWCGPCRQTMPAFERIEKEYQSSMVLLAINLQETKDQVREYIREEGLNSRVLLDEQGTVGRAYGAGAIPMQVLIDKAGVIRLINVGFNPSELRAEIERLR